jgi:hypothetical protein
MKNSLFPVFSVAVALVSFAPAEVRAAAAAAGLAVPAPDPSLEVGNRKQLFIDHKFIQACDGVSLTMNPPMRTGEILVQADAPWEKKLRVAHYSSIQAEGGRVRLWYSIVLAEREPRKNPKFMAVAYAESTDGLRFTKPILNLVEYDGSRANNFVLPTDPRLLSVGGGSVRRDENPACPLEEQYKSWMKIYPEPGSGIQGPSRLWVSPDGLHWKLAERRVAGLRATDTQSSWFWDPRVQRYVGYTREWVQFAGEGRIRMASYNESEDMVSWNKTFIALQPDEADWAANVRPLVAFDRMEAKGETLLENSGNGPKPARGRGEPALVETAGDQVPTPGAPVDIYGPGVSRYTEAEGVYISLMTLFHHWSITNHEAYPDTSDVRLGVSRDARHFMQPGGRKPFLGTGPAGAFDSKWLWPLPSPIRRGDELWIYYFGSNVDHSLRMDPAAKTVLAGISRAVMRLDGFVSADFEYGGGSLITPPLRFAGSRLELNLDTGAGGVGRVEILDESGEPVPGFTLREADQLNGNSVRTVVAWQGRSNLSVLAGKSVRLHFKMRSAKLYAFQFQ